MNEDDELPDFDWSPRGRTWWTENKSFARATERQMRFACAFLRCGNQSKAAADAGYSGGEAGIRQAGNKARHSSAVITLLGLAAAEDGDGETVVDIPELKLILSRAARSGTTSDRVKAGDALIRVAQIEEKQRERSRPKSPKAILAELAKIDVFIADYMAKKYWGVPAETYLDGFDSTPADSEDESDAEGVEKMEGATA